MWFLIKTAFWFAIVLMLLPLIDPQPAPTSKAGTTVEVGATIAAATSAFDDLTGLCRRQPSACETGGRTLAALGSRARDGALIAYRFLDKRFGGDAGDVVTGTIAGRNPKSQAAASRPVPPARNFDVADIPVPTPAPTNASYTMPATSQAADMLPKPYLPPAR